MKIGVVIQARMGSTRLPGKVLKEVNGKTLLAYQIERVRRVQSIDEIIIATTTEPQDDQIVDFCISNNVNYFRGSVFDPVIIDKVIETFIGIYPNVDYVSNTIERTYPRGMDTEIMSFSTLQRAHSNANEMFFREHVTSYIYNHPEKFRILNVAAEENQSDYRLTVDTEEDFELIKRILEKLYKESKDFTLKEIVKLLESNPSWKKINQHIEQKKYNNF
ncbi:MAG: acylneuraminate cytidylyltransferase [Bacillales bacterium]|nr:acylneuraminate cytidylyltransferase [Bacillales bacterium]